MSKAFFEKYPLVEPGEPPPEKNLNGIWKGLNDCRTRHGPAEVYWQFGCARRAWDVLTPSGREDVCRTMGSHWRRKGRGHPRWVFGKIEVFPDDVVFHDDPPPIFPRESGSLERTLAGSPKFIAELRDFRFARAVYSSLRRREFIHAHTREVWACGDKEAAYIVESLGDSGDLWEDFYPNEILAGEPPADRAVMEAYYLSKIRELNDAAKSIEFVPLDQLAALNRCLQTGRAELPETHGFWKIARSNFGHLIYENIDVFDRVDAYIQETGWLRNDIDATVRRLEFFDPSPIIAALKRARRWPYR